MFFLPKFIFRTPLNPSNSCCNDIVFNEAIYLSTPIFYQEYQKHLVKPLIDSKELKKLNISLYKYQTRASHRCTPFGLFAGLSIGDWKLKNEIIIDSDLKKSLNRKTRLDMNVLYSLAQELAKQVFIKPYLSFYPNSIIYLIGNSYRYVEYYYSNNKRFHKINKVDFSDYLQSILKEAKSGLSFHELISLLISDEISIVEASDFVNELIGSQLLINQLEPTVTGDDYFDVLISNLKSINDTNQSAELSSLIFNLEAIMVSIKNIDDNIFNDISNYKLVHQQLKNILPELTEINLFQTDLYKTSSSKDLNSDIQQQFKKTIQFLNKISPIYPNKNLEEFKKRFTERFEDYEIPLLVALDTEAGVGYPAKNVNGVNELIDDVYSVGILTSDSDIKWNLLQSHLLKLISESNKQNKKVIEISEVDFNGIDFSKGNLPTSFSIMFKILNSTTNKIDLNGIGGSSAINLLGRFAGGSSELNTIVKTISEFEQQQNPDKILAEIVHLPESRVGNILARPSFRSYEIPYLAKSFVGDDFQIKMVDLTLKLKDDKIILFDKRLQKEIIPRLGNAHNFSPNSLPLYHFLCDIQTQYFTKSHIGFNWGVLEKQFDFLPRVEFQNTVLSSAKWQVRKKDLEPLQHKKKSDIEKHALFYELKNKIELPDKFLIADGDNELLIDCNNPIAIDTFIDAVKSRNDITLEEYLFEDDHALIKDSDGNSFTNECIAIVLNESNVKEQTNLIASKTFSSKQVFSIGSEWLYYKIYCGSKTADFILTEKIKHITETLLGKGIIDKWFFIRYSDPDVHLRFRLHISNFEKYGEVLQLINMELEPLLNQHLISKIQTDTYKRELERYGDTSMDLAETLFYTDSIFVMNMLEMLDTDSGGTVRWKMALRSVDEFLNDFKLSVEEKYNFINRLSTSFFNEHGGEKGLKLILDNKFRTLRKQLDDILNNINDEVKEFYPIIELIEARSKSNEKIIEMIFLLDANKELQLSINELIASLLHMNLDRLFMGRNRTNEFVVYDLLARYYKSNLARLKSKSEKEVEFKS
jgi:thiopeptide-type bacteriocin biosynthesis protein